MVSDILDGLNILCGCFPPCRRLAESNKSLDKFWTVFVNLTVFPVESGIFLPVLQNGTDANPYFKQNGAGANFKNVYFLCMI